MLSLVGSIQSDPFAPEHVPSHTNGAASQSEPAADLEPVGLTDELQQMGLDEGGDSEEDTFGMLGRLGDEAAAREAEEAATKEKKRKRKEARLLEDGGEPDNASSIKRTKKKKS